MDVSEGTTAPGSRPQGRRGFSLVELVIALLILSIGVLGLAGTTAFVVRQTTLADVNTERSAALQSAVERVRATPYTAVGTGSTTVGAFSVGWSVIDSTGTTKIVRVITRGPGLAKDSVSLPTLAASVQDTFTLTLLEP